MFRKHASVWYGIGTGTLLSTVSGLIYLIMLHEPGSVFYLFAAIAFLVGPLLGGIIAARKTQGHRRRDFLFASAAIFGLVCVGFIYVYAVFPLADRTSVQLPEFCDGYHGDVNPPAGLVYTLPDGQTGILITEDAQSAVVAVVDRQNAPFPGTAFLVNKASNTIIGSMRFENDVISAALDGDTLYLYNDKLGYFVDARTGALMDSFLTIDNYGGLSGSDNPLLMTDMSSDQKYVETSAVISSWHVDGSVSSRRYLKFNGIALGCYIDADTHSVIDLE